MGDYPDMPDLPPAKTFFGKLVSVAADVSREKKTPFFRFTARITDPGKDVTESELEKIKSAGFSLADYNVTSDHYLTPNSMRMFRRFMESLGFPPNVSFVDALKLNPETLNPTEETQELIRGKDVIMRTPAMDGNGRVYNRMDSMAGTKRD